MAGFPCQPFSNAGNRKGVNDDNGRGTLFEECERILKAKVEKGVRPKAFVFENVRGIMSSRMADGTTVPDEIRKRMEALGYRVAAKLLCASNYGVPQMRYRYLIIGVDNTYPSFDFTELDNIVGELNIPSVSHSNDEKLLLGTILQGTEGLPDNDFWPQNHSKKKNFLNLHLKDVPGRIFHMRNFLLVLEESLTILKNTIRQNFSVDLRMVKLMALLLHQLNLKIAV